MNKPYRHPLPNGPVISSRKTMIESIREALDRLDHENGIEIEFRFHIPNNNDAAVSHNMFSKAFPATVPKKDTVLASNQTDMRKVGKVWQRKRRVERIHFEFLRGIRANMTMSVESPCDQPCDSEERLLDIVRRRTRYSYASPPWVTQWTSVRGKTGMEVELEFQGNIEDMKRSDNGCNVRDPLSRIIACLAWKYYKPAFTCKSFVADTQGTVVPKRSLAQYRQWRAKMQPVSLRRNMMLPTRGHRFSDVMLSHKMDGTRSIMIAVRKDGIHSCWMLGHDAWIIFEPCVQTSYDLMVLDGEFMESTNTFVAFDLWELSGNRALSEQPYRYRWEMLRSINMPRMHSTKVQVKQLYTAATCPPPPTGIADGVIVHDMKAKIHQGHCTLKWKPTHTVDLMSNGGSLHASRDSENEFCFYCDAAQSPPIGQVWECTFHPTLKSVVVPVKHRPDKKQANDVSVVKDIYAAHLDKITFDELLQLTTCG